MSANKPMTIRIRDQAHAKFDEIVERNGITRIEALEAIIDHFYDSGFTIVRTLKVETPKTSK